MATSLSEVPEPPDAPPPSYAVAVNDAPPSYQSLFSDLKRTKQESVGNTDFAQNACKLCCAALCGSVVVFTIICVVTAIPVAMLAVGASYFNDCPAEKYIPIYLIVAGAVCILTLFSLGNGTKRRYSVDTEEDETSGCRAGFAVLVTIFLFAWFIAGNVWVYRIHGNWSPNESTINYCHPTLYKFAFWMITSTYILFGVIVLGTICCVLLACFIGRDANCSQYGSGDDC